MAQIYKTARTAPLIIALMDEATVLARLRRHWEFAASDQDVSHQIYHDDAVLEFPQSQERFEGKQNFITWRRQYPARVDFRVRRIRGGGALWVAELSIRYDGSPWQCGVSILEFRDDKVARETIYIAEGWQAPEWRAPWRTAWRDESLG